MTNKASHIGLNSFQGLQGKKHGNTRTPLWKNYKRFEDEKKRKDSCSYPTEFKFKQYDFLRAIELHQIFVACRYSKMYETWMALTKVDKKNLTQYLFSIQKSNISKLPPEQLYACVKKHNHFPVVLANLFFDIAYHRGLVESLATRLLERGWNGLITEDKIVLLFDLVKLYPELINNSDNIYDLIFESPDYVPAQVVKEWNRLVVFSNDYLTIFQKFKHFGWRNLSVDEKVVLINGLSISNRGITEGLDEVLYNVRMYDDVPPIVVAERDQAAIEHFKISGVLSNLVGAMIHYVQYSGKVLGIAGVPNVKIRKVKGLGKQQ